MPLAYIKSLIKLFFPQVDINDIVSIEFLEWREYADKNNSFIFYPSKILLTIKKNKKYNLQRLPEFNKIEFSENQKKIILFAYFCDYWERGRWQNSNSNDRLYPTKNPLPGTLIKIVFKNTNNPANKILKFITK